MADPCGSETAYASPCVQLELLQAPEALLGPEAETMSVEEAGLLGHALPRSAAVGKMQFIREGLQPMGLFYLVFGTIIVFWEDGKQTMIHGVAGQRFQCQSCPSPGCLRLCQGKVIACTLPIKVLMILIDCLRIE